MNINIHEDDIVEMASLKYEFNSTLYPDGSRGARFKIIDSTI